MQQKSLVLTPKNLIKKVTTINEIYESQQRAHNQASLPHRQIPAYKITRPNPPASSPQRLMENLDSRSALCRRLKREKKQVWLIYNHAPLVFFFRLRPGCGCILSSRRVRAIFSFPERSTPVRAFFPSLSLSLFPSTLFTLSPCARAIDGGLFVYRVVGSDRIFSRVSLRSSPSRREPAAIYRRSAISPALPFFPAPPGDARRKRVMRFPAEMRKKFSLFQIVNWTVSLKSNILRIPR